jgi:hypothetical protein
MAEEQAALFKSHTFPLKQLSKTFTMGNGIYKKTRTVKYSRSVEKNHLWLLIRSDHEQTPLTNEYSGNNAQ